jgi:3-dehydrosphinganine reductase
MRNNYFTAAFTAQSLFKIWTEDDRKLEVPTTGRAARRRLAFINSAGAFLGLPGCTAYTRNSSPQVQRGSGSAL